MTGTKSDPLEGFHFTHFDPVTKRVTIELHPSVLKNPRSVERMEEICQKIIEAGGIDGVDIEPRK